MDTFLSPWLIWFLIGIGLALLELQLPGFVIIFFGIGCLMTSAVLLIADISPEQQIIVFLAGSIISLLALRRFLMRIFQGISSDSETQLDAAPVGVRVKVMRPISPEMPGKISYRGSFWDAEADERIEADETVEILGYAHNSRSTFRVRKV